MNSEIARPGRIEGYAIVSVDGMLADAAGTMPKSLKFDADQKFFEHGLDAVDVVVHGRHSRERNLRSSLRRRIIVTHRVPTIFIEPSQEKLLFWNPAGTSFEEALSLLGIPYGSVGVLGGTDVFGLFLHCYDVFHLTRAPGVRLPGGRPVFSGVPARTPEDILAAQGLVPGPLQILDATRGLTVVSWRRLSNARRPLQSQLQLRVPIDKI